jgi:signal transduction histidine kinase
LLGTIPLIILGVILLVGQYLTLRDFTLESNLEHAQLAAAYIDGWLTGQIRILQSFAQSGEIQSGKVTAIQGLVRRQIRVQTDWDVMWITDAQGREIVNTGGARLFNVSDRDYFRQAKRTLRPAVSDLIIARATGHPIIAIAYPILIHGTFQGIIGAGISPSEFQRVFTQAIASQGSTLALWGRDHRLIARTGPVNGILGRTFNTPETPAIFSGQSGTTISTSPILGRRVLIGFVPVTVAPWTVTAAVPLSQALSPTIGTLAMFVALGLLVLGLTVAWSRYSADVVSGQVRTLTDSARAIGEGHLDTRVQLTIGGELGELGQSLNKMAADLQVIDRLKYDLLSMISHELKTPLTSIRTSLDILETGLIGPEHPRYQELLHIAERQSRRLQDMIENILSVARLEGGGLAITPRATPLAQIIMQSVPPYREMAEAKGLTLTVETPDTLSVRVDRQKIVLALNNVLDNAVKFTAQGGITLRASTDAGFAVITITDTGIGLSDEVRARLFERFYQAEPLMTRKAGGSGLGLYVTRAIIEAHGGTIFAESAGPGHGSTFGFTVPLVLQ